MGLPAVGVGGLKTHLDKCQFGRKGFGEFP